MKRRMILALLVLAVLVPPLAQATRNFAPSSVIVGHIYLDRRSNAAGVTVRVGGQSAITSSDGGFIIPNSPSGVQTIVASAPGFLPAEATQYVVSGQLLTMPDVTLQGGDVDADGKIGLLDLIALGSRYAECPPSLPGADVTGDGCVNLLDLVAVGINYGLVGPSAWGAASTATSTPISVVTSTPTATETPTLRTTATATDVPNQAITCAYVVDGDTIEISTGERLRYIGVDTTEQGDCFAAEATQRNRDLVQGKAVRLEKDVSEVDRYGRLLRYVYVDVPGVGEVMVNAMLVHEGYALAKEYPPDTTHAAWFAALEAEARALGRGLWSACATPTATRTPTATAIQAVQPTVAATTLPSTESSVQVNWPCCQVDAPGNDNYNLQNEWVCFQNYGAGAQNMTGWHVRDDFGWTYDFSGFTLQPRGTVKLHTGVGANTAADLYWGRIGSAVWNNSGDVIKLYDAAWVLVDSYTYQGQDGE